MEGELSLSGEAGCAWTLCLWLAHTEILEQVLPLWSVHGAPLPILVLLPRNITE